MNETTSRNLQFISALLEAILAIPFIGGIIVISSGYTALVVMLILHATTYYFCSRTNRNASGSIIGIVTSLIAWIPIIGWAMHLSTAILLFINSAIKERQLFNYDYPNVGYDLSDPVIKPDIEQSNQQQNEENTIKEDR